MGVLYFPGLARHHSLWGYGAFQKTSITRSSNNYLFRNEVPIPRGYSVSRYQEFYSWSANYTLPLWYPDVAIGPLVNLQRLRSNVFFDYGFGRNPIVSQSDQYSSVGIEVKLDMNILRFLPQFDIGVRFTQGLTPAVSKFEMLIGAINL
jgi:hypothetical protein